MTKIIVSMTAKYIKRPSSFIMKRIYVYKLFKNMIIHQKNIQNKGTIKTKLQSTKILY